MVELDALNVCAKAFSYHCHDCERLTPCAIIATPHPTALGRSSRGPSRTAVSTAASRGAVNEGLSVAASSASLRGETGVAPSAFSPPSLRGEPRDERFLLSRFDIWEDRGQEGTNVLEEVRLVDV